MSEPTEAEKAAAEILKLLPRPVMMDTWMKNQDKLVTIIQRCLNEKDAKNYKLIMENVSAANEICNWQSLCEKKDAEIERLKQHLAEATIMLGEQEG